MKLSHAVIGLTALLLCVSTSSLARSNRRHDWDQQLDLAEKAILAGKYRAAREQMIATARGMTGYLGPGKGGEILYGLVALHRALAEAGLGNEDDAHWYYQVALAFNPLLADYGLDRFGEPGRFLLEMGASTAFVSADAAAADKYRGGASSTTPRVVTPPKAKKRPKPNFPYGAGYFRVSGPLIVQVIVSEDGRPTYPNVLESLQAASLTWVALEAVRKWRFEPARVNGEPVAVYYNVTVNYRFRK